MRKFLLCLVCFMISFMMQAGEVSRQEALEKARQFMPNKEFKQHESSQRKVSAVATTNSPYYVFNAENNSGFVIVSGDDRTEAILGYSDKGSIDVDRIPEGLQDLLDGYKKQIEYLATQNEIKVVKRVREDWEDITPLIMTTWNQRSPYNMLCPIDSETGDRCITGCTATAIAQIMYYHKWPEVGKGVISYDWRGKTLSEDLSKIHFDWDKMHPYYNDEIPDEYNAVAKLMYAVALVCRSDFGLNSTVGWFDTEMLKKYFYYKYSDYLSFESSSFDVIEGAIYNDLINQRPVLLWSEEPGAEYEVGDAGHLMVIDGYQQEEGLFHINMGWGGYADGYYRLDAVEEYTLPMAIMYNIEPDYNIPSVEITSMDLGTEVLMLDEGERVGLTYTYTPDDADVSTIVWSSDDERVAVVSGDGLVSVVGKGTCNIIASSSNNNKQQCKVIVGNTSGLANGHGYVDLGLPSGTLWATANIGAHSIEDFGDYIQWGETSVPNEDEEEDSYGWYGYDFFNVPSSPLKKYCTDTDLWAGEGNPDGLQSLEDEDDAAYVMWGAYWHIPSVDQFRELMDENNTSYVLTQVNGVSGYLITSRLNGKCIFLPAASFHFGSTYSLYAPNARYWSSTLAEDNYKAYSLWMLESDSFSEKVPDQALERCCGLPIRPVYIENMKSNSITVTPTDLNFGTVAIGESRTMDIVVKNNTFEMKEISPFRLDAKGFSLDWTGGEIQPNSNQTIKVTYSPTEEAIASGGSFRIGTKIESILVNVAASSHKNSGELTTKQNLVVWTIDGACTKYLLNELPIVTIDKDVMSIDGKSSSAEYKFSDILKLTYEDVITDVEAIDGGDLKPFTQSSEAVTFFSEETDLHVAIISMSGVVVKKITAKQGHAETVSLSQLPTGVYVISVNNISYKITKR